MKEAGSRSHYRGKVAQHLGKKGFGFVRLKSKNRYLFFHKSDVMDGRFHALAVGEVVSFDAMPDRRHVDRLCAVNVKSLRWTDDGATAEQQAAA
jgi:cold shock CspA family protein